jgi:DNA mismatch repair protein MutL
MVNYIEQTKPRIMNSDSRISILPPETANRIAAGEEVERPASVLKELLENSLDAGADRISINIEGAGSRLIRVADNGRGMGEEDLGLCLLRHATSKIREAQDLEQILTLGFRGEALPSIAAVSRFTIRSRLPEAEIGYQVQAEGGPPGAPEAAAAPPGTIAEVKDLFFNLPARRKFLKSPATESGHLAACLIRLALSRPEITFSYQVGQQTLYQLPASDDLRARAGALLGREVLPHLVEARWEGGPLTVRGLVSLPSLHRPDADQVFIFINGRFVRDKVLLHALSQAYQEFLPHNRRPVVILYLNMDPSLLDVNVHPAKTEVRFQDSGAIHQALRRGLRAALAQGAENTGSAESAGPAGAADYGRLYDPRLSPAGEDYDPAALSLASQAPAEAEVLPAYAAFMDLDPAGQNGRPAAGPIALPPKAADSALPDPSSPDPKQARWLWPLAEEKTALPPVPFKARPLFQPVSRVQALAQLHELYILASQAEGLLIIDQHAAYERLHYEDLRQAWDNGVCLSQALLQARPVDLTPQEMALAESGRETWQRLGLELSPFGPRSLAVQAVPPAWVGCDPEPLLRQLLSEARLITPASPEFVQSSLRSLACRRSVRQGQRLQMAAMQALLDRLFKLPPPLTCPHGRPVVLRLAGEELWRAFQRG